MNIKFEYRENGSPMITLVKTTGEKIFSEPVSYQGIASVQAGKCYYIAVGDYYLGHTPMQPGRVYQISEV